ncbi:hypothetical protein DHW03_01555 [Pedobacter yonginense]|uniref:Uncharacterized protein n=1 Tax=Pedobacter yonginense TaxID=651869 RepID=A0A317ER01_9SPHI|nr:hypothetical protein [Pedobacter yonginense]PWS28567.1 hypothetical protein DHW03_01555 [Pedobacter yonginense]
MKKILSFIAMIPLFAQAQDTEGFRTGSFIGVLLATGFMILLFLALRQLVLWYWKIDKIVAYQEQNITALQAIYDAQEALLKVARAQQEILKEISDNLKQGS